LINNFIKDVMKYLPAQIVPAVLAFVAIPIITRLFSASDYGNYTLVTTTVSILTILMSWITASTIRFYQTYEKQNQASEYCTNILNIQFFFVIAVAIVCIGILFLVKIYLSIELWNLMLLGILVFILSCSYQTFLFLLRAKLISEWYTGFSLWNAVASLGIGIGIVLFLNKSVSGLLWGVIVANIMVIPLLVKTAFGRNIHFGIKHISPNILKEMLKYGVPLVVGNLASWILNISDRYIIAFSRTTSEVGIYSASNTISENSIFLLSNLVTLAAGPLGMRVWEQQGMQKSSEFTAQVTRYFLLICLPVFAGISALSKPILMVLTAPEYYEGYRIMAMAAGSGLLIGLMQRYQTGLIYHKKTVHIMSGTIIAGLLNLGLNLWLVPEYGYMAAAINTLFSIVILLVLMIIISRKYFTWPFPFRSLFKAVLASLVMGAGVYYLYSRLASAAVVSLLISIVAGVVIYVIMLFILRAYQPEEISWAKNIAKSIFKRS
jgi:O-antigen/teichoic acid export membrane protein